MNSPAGISSPVLEDPSPTASVRAPTEGLPTPERLASAARVLFIIVATLGLAHVTRPVVLPLLLAWIASMTLKTPVLWLNRLGLSAPLSALIVVSLVVLSLGFGATRLAAPAAAWIAAAPEELPRLRQKFAPILRPAARLSEAASRVGKLEEDGPIGTLPKVEVQDHRVADTVFTWTGGLVAGAAETVALLFLFLASGNMFMQKLVRVVPRLRSKKRIVEISREIHSRISTYLFAVGLINLGFGIIVALVLFLVGLPNPVMWGAMAALVNFVPYVGPFLGLIVLGVAGLGSFDTLELGFLPALVFLVLHLMEANVVTPFVLGRRFALNPVVIFLALVFLLWLWGVIGALLAGPLLVSAKVICERVPELAFVAELLSPDRAQELPS
ncbi:MAG: AI-2E family transporter [Verrucomicrobiales bacterium]|nr:AI-2E family transporter [Verrucomicrobiales bacterium]